MLIANLANTRIKSPLRRESSKPSVPGIDNPACRHIAHSRRIHICHTQASSQSTIWVEGWIDNIEVVGE